jgi:DNA-binding GntR family transcriptional regulator
LQPIVSTPNRAQQVYELIRDSICDCSLEPGRHLVQEELASTLGVSRQPVQQAMLLLKNDGLVVELGGRGLYVAPLDPDAVMHRYQIRVVMDQMAARLVAAQAAASPRFAARLRKEGDAILMEGQAAQLGGDAVETVGHDVRFHSFLYDMSGNPLIAPTADPHWYYLRRVMIAVLLHADRGPLVWEQHRNILDALVRGDIASGLELVTSHVTGAETALLAALRSRGSGAAEDSFRPASGG